ncbi:MAG: restriction endonuclease subunit S [Bacteroidota bacterium]
MKKYDTYKDSGIEWIGEIPDHWQVQPVKYVIDKNKGVQIGPFGSSLKSDFVKSFGFKIYGQENVIKSDFSLGYKYLDDEKFDELSKYELLEGDIVITMMGTTGKCQVVPSLSERGLIDSHLIRIRVNRNKISSTFFTILINDSYSIYNNIKIESRGSIMEGLNSSIIKSLILPIPPLEEQTAIANYLDRKTAEIDELIADKKRLLELYEEEKTAIINQAVTKGLDPNVPMKDSGVEWLGEIPAHWEVKKVKHVLKSLDHIRVPLSADQRGRMLDRKYDYYGASGVIDKVEDYLFDESLLLIGEDGANLVTRSTRLAFIAKGKYWVNNHAHILKPTYGILEYYAELMEICDYSLWVSGSAQPKLTSENLLNIWIIVPPEEEQMSIVEHITSQLSNIDLQVNRTQKLINLLTEYRTALISEAVTGKIKVTE